MGRLSYDNPSYYHIQGMLLECIWDISSKSQAGATLCKCNINIWLQHSPVYFMGQLKPDQNIFILPDDDML